MNKLDLNWHAPDQNDFEIEEIIDWHDQPVEFIALFRGQRWHGWFLENFHDPSLEDKAAWSARYLLTPIPKDNDWTQMRKFGITHWDAFASYGGVVVDSDWAGHFLRRQGYARSLADIECYLPEWEKGKRLCRAASEGEPFADAAR